VIFDTDVLIWFLDDDPAAVQLIDSIDNRAVSIVTEMELLQGARSKLDARTIKDLLRSPRFRVIPLTEVIGEVALALIEDHALSDGLRVADALIAATARETGQTLATGNVRHFRSIPRLHLKHFRPKRGLR
jgi:predicted nucleic acid-binding protein